MYNYTIRCLPEDVTIRELTLLQCSELQTACIRLDIAHHIERIQACEHSAIIGTDCKVCEREKKNG